MSRRRHHLPQLFNAVRRTALWRVAKLLDLSGARAGAAGAKPPVDYAGDAPCRGEGEAVPVDGRVSIRLISSKEVSIFDKGKAADNQRRNSRETLVGPFGVARAIQRIAVAVEQ